MVYNLQIVLLTKLIKIRYSLAYIKDLLSIKLNRFDLFNFRKLIIVNKNEKPVQCSSLTDKVKHVFVFDEMLNFILYLKKMVNIHNNT